jgi:hypothetical protein
METNLTEFAERFDLQSPFYWDDALMETHRFIFAKYTEGEDQSRPFIGMTH